MQSIEHIYLNEEVIDECWNNENANCFGVRTLKVSYLDWRNDSTDEEVSNGNVPNKDVRNRGIPHESKHRHHHQNVP